MYRLKTCIGGSKELDRPQAWKRFWQRTRRGLGRAWAKSRSRGVARVAARQATKDCRVLVEVGMGALSGGHEELLVLGTNPYDERVTCLADLTEIGALPTRAFDTVILAATMHRGHADVVV